VPVPLPEHEKRAISQYVQSQTRDYDDPEKSPQVTLVQKVASHRLLGRNHDIYDVHTDGGRWWVITEMTNLYSQEDFPQYDVAFSLHVGLMLRMMERDRVTIEEEAEEQASSAWRRFEAAVEAMHTAREAEDFQGIGIKCREAFLAFVRENQSAEWLPTPQAPPKAGDFKGWTELFAQALSTGRMRRYLKEVAAKAWDMAVGLQHDADATDWDAEVMLDAASHVLNVFSTAIVRSTRTPPERCPRCGSYRYVTDGDLASLDGTDGWTSRRVCSACGHKGPETFTPWTGRAELDDDLGAIQNTSK